MPRPLIRNTVYANQCQCKKSLLYSKFLTQKYQYTDVKIDNFALDFYNRI